VNQVATEQLVANRHRLQWTNFLEIECKNRIIYFCKLIYFILEIIFGIGYRTTGGKPTQAAVDKLPENG